MQEIINYIEDHLNEKIDLDSIADVHHYSKYYIHRQFSHQFGITIHTYIRRRQLTKAAKLLVFSKEPILEIALKSGYESQQAFTVIFKLMYKKSPAQFRRSRKYYPLQYRFVFDKKRRNCEWKKSDIHTAKMSDIPSWMKLLRSVVDGYPMLVETEHEEQLRRFIEKKQALILKDEDMIIGALAFSVNPCHIEFIAVHPQYRNCGIQKLLIETLQDLYCPNEDISITTFRKKDPADTGYRTELKQLGFIENDLLIELGYPTQRFTLPSRRKEKGKEQI